MGTSISTTKQKTDGANNLAEVGEEYHLEMRATGQYGRIQSALPLGIAADASRHSYFFRQNGITVPLELII